jgi:hypothetical protein
MALQHPRSPLDDILGLEEVPPEKVRALEERLRQTYLPKVRTQQIASAQRAQEMRKVMLF